MKDKQDGDADLDRIYRSDHQIPLEIGYGPSLDVRGDFADVRRRPPRTHLFQPTTIDCSLSMARLSISRSPACSISAAISAALR